MTAWTSLRKRTFRFISRLPQEPKLFLYFFIVICLVGAAGTWIPLAQVVFGNPALNWFIVNRSLATYIIAISVAAFADCVVSKREEDDPAFMLLLLGLAISSLICACIVLLNESETLSNWFSRIGAIVAAVVWLMVHDDNPMLVSANAYSAIGGEKAK